MSSKIIWRAEEQGDLVTVWQVIETDGHFEDVIANELTEEQAHLIAAAPQMREALRHMLDGRAGCRDEARATLQAADGESE